MNSFPTRCQHIKVNGTQCGCPALRRNKLCYFHKRHHDERVQLNLDRLKDGRAGRRRATVELPVLEDANSIQVCLMQIMRLLLSGQIDHKTAALLLYALQTASSNLRLTNFQPYQNYVVLDPRTVGQTPLNGFVWKDSDFDDEEEEEDDDDGKAAAPPPAPAPAPQIRRNTGRESPPNTRPTPAKYIQPIPREDMMKELSRLIGIPAPTPDTNDRE